MKNLIIVLFLALSLVLSGCATRATVSGGPTINVPPAPAGKGGFWSKVFAPNNMATVTNNTEFLVVLSVHQIPYGSYEVHLMPGQIAELRFYQYHGSGRANIIARAYELVDVVAAAQTLSSEEETSIKNPLNGVFVGATSRTFSLTSNGGYVRTYDWIIRGRTSSSRRVIY